MLLKGQLYSIAIFLISLNLGDASGKPMKYNGYQVHRALVPANVSVAFDILLKSCEADVWREPSTSIPSFDVMVSPELSAAFVKGANKIGVKVDTIIENAQQLINEEKAGRSKGRRFRRKSWKFQYNRYHTLEEIEHWMRYFARANRDIVKIVQVGTSYEGRRILALKIGVPSKSRAKRIIWQDALIHAREWITGGTLIWLSRHIVENYRDGNPEFVTFLKELDWYILPVWNVDGYKFTWTEDRMWRKSRSSGGSFDCYGVDLNRNFLTPKIGVGSSSDNPCSEVYHGQSPFSEIESFSVQQFLLKKKSLIVAVITLHSYAQYWLYPYGYTTEITRDDAILERISRDAVAAVQKKYGTAYRYGTVSQIAYVVSGGSIDWSYHSLCTKYTFGVELRDTGEHGFLLPPSHIIPTAEEYFEGVKVIARHIIQESIDVQTSGMCRNGVKHY